MIAEIDEAILYVARKTVSPAVVDLHRKYLSSGKTCKYPMTDTEIRSWVIPQGVTSYFLENPITGKIPLISVIGLVSNKAFVGAVDESAFNYEAFDLSALSLNWVTDSVETRTIEYSFTTKRNPHVSESFLLALDSLKATASDPELGNGISRTTYHLQGKFNRHFTVSN